MRKYTFQALGSDTSKSLISQLPLQTHLLAKILYLYHDKSTKFHSEILLYLLKATVVLLDSMGIELENSGFTLSLGKYY